MKITNNDPTEAAFLSSFGAAQKAYTEAQGAYSAASSVSSEEGMFQAQQDMQKQLRIMSGIANLSQTIHNMLMKLIDKLNIRV